MVAIVQKENPVLRKVAKSVPVSQIKSERIQTVIKNMVKALSTQNDGVAIAAPQIGESLRIFVISGKAFDPEFKRGRGGPNNKKLYPDLVFINPEFVKLSKKTLWLPEGCLSVRWLYGEVKRSTNATITAYNEKGEKFTRGGGGLLAHIFQHETDHLNGVLFIEKAKNIEEGQPETYYDDK